MLLIKVYSPRTNVRKLAAPTLVAGFLDILYPLRLSLTGPLGILGVLNTDVSDLGLGMGYRISPGRATVV